MATYLRKIAIFHLALLSLASVLLAREVDSGMWPLIHPNSKALIGIQWAAVQHSEVGKWLRQRWIGDLEVPGLDFSKDVQQVLISSPGRLGGQEPQLLIAVRGNFDQKRVEEALIRAGTSRQMFSGVAVYRPRAKGSSDPSFALLTEHVILIGDPASLFSTIERSRLPRPADEGSFLERAQALDLRYDCWALLTDPASMQNFMFASLVGKTMSAEAVGLEAGISVRDGLAIDVVMNSPNERTAKAMQGHVTHMVELAAQDQKAPADFSSLVGKLRVSTDRNNVLMSLRMTDAEVAKSLEAKPRIVVADKPQVIRIEGLDDGPRVVPLQP